MWDVRINKTVEKRLKKIPKETAESFFLLLRDLKAKGPDVKSWPNYSKMVNKKEVYHCHLNKNKPRFVAIWKVMDFSTKLIEIIYVGSHENAHYGQIK